MSFSLCGPPSKASIVYAFTVRVSTPSSASFKVVRIKRFLSPLNSPIEATMRGVDRQRSTRQTITLKPSPKPDMPDPHPDLTAALYEAYRRALREAKYRAPYFLELLEERHGYETARPLDAPVDKRSHVPLRSSETRKLAETPERWSRLPQTDRPPSLVRLIIPLCGIVGSNPTPATTLLLSKVLIFRELP